MLTCKQVSRLISESLDRDLPLRQRMSMRMHLFMCKLCSRYSRQSLSLREAIRLQSEREEEIDVYPASLSSEARERIKESLSRKSDELK